jgi:hypothetical protein
VSRAAGSDALCVVRTWEVTWQSPNGVIDPRSYALTLPKEVANLQMSRLTVLIRERFRQQAAFIEQIPRLASEF